MYEAFYGLKEKPFSILPDPSFLYWAGGHRRAFAMLEYGLLRTPGFTVITGEVGAGKTTLLRHLLKRLPRNITVGYLANVQPGQGPLLEWVMMAFDLDAETSSIPALHRRFRDFLVGECSQGRRVLLIVDEAQNLDTRSLEELRMLSNINAEKENILQIALAGQPELKECLCRPELRQFVQRVTSEFHLGVLSPEETREYIAARLTHAGGRPHLIATEACDIVHSATGGNPRLINVLCDIALTYGFAEGVNQITGDLVTKVLEDKRRYGALTSASW